MSGGTRGASKVCHLLTPKLASRMDELIIVIQAIVVQEDTVVGYRFANGGNGSDWLKEFLSMQKVAIKCSYVKYITMKYN